MVFNEIKLQLKLLWMPFLGAPVVFVSGRRYKKRERETT